MTTLSIDRIYCSCSSEPWLLHLVFESLGRHLRFVSIDDLIRQMRDTRDVIVKMTGSEPAWTVTDCRDVPYFLYDALSVRRVDVIIDQGQDQRWLVERDSQNIVRVIYTSYREEWELAALPEILAEIVRRNLDIDLVFLTEGTRN